jgi:Tetrapyrrole (Corrin/Porphyrin) Methylases
MPGTGSLIVVGTGIRTVGHMTVEAISWIRISDKVLYVVGDPVAEALIRELNPQGAESLIGLYAVGKPRLLTYNEMIDRTLACVRQGLATCLACYGHPGVFVYPSHESIRRARAEGFVARMLPGISAEDCLFADLGVDPGIDGCQSYEATDFLASDRAIDPTSSVVLWQIGVLGDPTYKVDSYNTPAMPLLIERLLRTYPPNHVVYLYEAAVFVGCEPIITRVTIPQLGAVPLSAGYTLYIPPAFPPRIDRAVAYRMHLLAGSATQ